MADLKLDECNATFVLKKHYEAPPRLSFIVGKATHPTHGEVATLIGLVLNNRNEWKRAGDFMEMMDAESDEMMRFSTQVFDNDMDLLPWLADGGRRSGTGCWGAELNRGDIIYVQYMNVKPQFRGRGLGTWFLRRLLKSPQVMKSSIHPTHVFCWPAVEPREVGSNDQVVSFFQKSGFRRIGRTLFFCYTSDLGHPSHKVPMSDDATQLDSDFVNPATLTPSELKAQFPLHVAVFSLKTHEIATVIRDAHTIDPAAIHKKSLDGFTLTHITAATHNLHALRILLELGVSDDLRDSTNSSGTTPLEALDESMRSNRLFMETFGILWNGYSDDELTCQYLVKKALNVWGLLSSEAEYIAVNKFGCTCGQCIDGWLSGHMRFVLSACAIHTYDFGLMELSFLDGRHSKEEYLELTSMEHLPPALHHLVNKRFCQSWLQTFRAVHDVLDANVIPYHARLALLPDSSPYVMQGGRVEYVLDAITSHAKDRFDNEPVAETFSNDLEKTPSCANDSQFGLVRQKLGLDPRQVWGPYNDAEVDEMDEDDEDDEEDEDDEDDDDDKDEEDEVD